jgi:hypothetical protein
MAANPALTISHLRRVRLTALSSKSARLMATKASPQMTDNRIRGP